MRKYLTDYLQYIETELQKPDCDIKKLKQEHLVQIQFMQHERLIHLIVTVLFALLLFISLGIFVFSESIAFFILSVLVLALLIPYISHYYFLENNVQKMYTIYNQINNNGIS